MGAVSLKNREEWTCAVNGYAKQLHQILPRFEFKILNDKKNVVVEQKIGLNGSELIAGQDSVFHQGDLFITQFRSSKSGHLALFMDNGEKAQRMLPYYAYDNVDDVSVKANQWYSFFDISEPSGFPKENIDELALAMDETTLSLADGNSKVEKSILSMEQMNEQISSIRERVDSIFDDIDTQTKVTRAFSKQIENISQSYNTLSNDCLQTGRRIFKVGRYLDKTRSDLVRGCSQITDQDWLRVFEVDHFVLTWRVYNNIVGFEHLLKKQVDNPSGCKLGKWLNSVSDEQLLHSKEYISLVHTHEALHKYATLSWQAKEDGDTDKAMSYFNDTYNAYEEFDNALHRFQNKMQALGYKDITQITAFEKV